MSDYREAMMRDELAAANETESLTLELPARGPVSYDALVRCAREAEMPLADWVFDALAAYVRMHEREIRLRQIEAFGEPMREHERTPVPAWRARLGECAYRLADAITGTREI